VFRKNHLLDLLFTKGGKTRFTPVKKNWAPMKFTKVCECSYIYNKHRRDETPIDLWWIATTREIIVKNFPTTTCARCGFDSHRHYLGDGKVVVYCTRLSEKCTYTPNQLFEHELTVKNYLRTKCADCGYGFHHHYLGNDRMVVFCTRQTKECDYTPLLGSENLACIWHRIMGLLVVALSHY